MTLLFVLITMLLLGLLIVFQRRINAVIMKVRKRSCVYRVGGRRYYIGQLTPAQLSRILARFADTPFLKDKTAADALINAGAFIKLMRTNLDNITDLLAIVLVPVRDRDSPKTDADIDSLSKTLAMMAMSDILKMYEGFFFTNGTAFAILKRWMKAMANEAGATIGAIVKVAVKEYSSLLTSPQCAQEQQDTIRSASTY